MRIIFLTLFKGDKEMIRNIPSKFPKGCSLVVFKKYSHCHGGLCDQRFAAIPVRKWIDGDKLDYPFMAMKKIERISFFDSNSDYVFILPEGSFVFKEGVWKTCKKIEYDY